MYRHFVAKTPAGHMERLPSVSWCVKVYAGTDSLTGREIRLRRTCKTERAAQIELSPRRSAGNGSPGVPFAARTWRAALEGRHAAEQQRTGIPPRRNHRSSYRVA